MPQLLFVVLHCPRRVFSDLALKQKLFYQCLQLHKKPLSALNTQNRKRFNNDFRLSNSFSNSEPLFQQRAVPTIAENVHCFD